MNNAANNTNTIINNNCNQSLLVLHPDVLGHIVCQDFRTARRFFEYFHRDCSPDVITALRERFIQTVPLSLESVFQYLPKNIEDINENPIYNFYEAFYHCMYVFSHKFLSDKESQSIYQLSPFRKLCLAVFFSVVKEKKVKNACAMTSAKDCCKVFVETWFWLDSPDFSQIAKAMLNPVKCEGDMLEVLRWLEAMAADNWEYRVVSQIIENILKSEAPLNAEVQVQIVKLMKLCIKAPIKFDPELLITFIENCFEHFDKLKDLEQSVKINLATAIVHCEQGGKVLFKGLNLLT